MPWHLIDAKTHIDPRGALSAIDEHEFPFVPKRVYWIYDVPNGTVRGAHAHREQHQILICLQGVLDVLVDDGVNSTVIRLDSPNRYLHLPPMLWSEQRCKADSTRWVFIASGKLDPDEYIRTRAEWLKELV